ncbi:hypothetical protein O9992_19330 [Vibrio lentus]|nr:hypothetical protein [Vibrio lentus]
MCEELADNSISTQTPPYHRKLLTVSRKYGILYHQPFTPKSQDVSKTSIITW